MPGVFVLARSQLTMIVRPKRNAILTLEAAVGNIEKCIQSASNRQRLTQWIHRFPSRLLGLISFFWLVLQWSSIVWWQLATPPSIAPPISSSKESRERLKSGMASKLVCPSDRNGAQPFQVPDFVLIGAQKCGTTALAALLEKHPLLVRSSHFEEHFFDM